MKALYTGKGKIVLNDEILSLADSAAERVLQIAGENNWRASFEIDIPGTRCDDWHPGMPTEQKIIRVSLDSGIEDSAHAQVFRTFAGKTPSGSVKADLGEYDHEGWVSLIDYKDVRELPDVYFSDCFVWAIIDHRNTGLLQEVEPQYLKNVAFKIYKAVRRDKRITEMYMPEEKDLILYCQDIIDASRELYKGTQTSYESLIEILNRCD
ncbi:MAG: hypothetical protein QMD97_01655 [Candidatus Aenigmarchaeota archaeon]|nr:hypothetical protein [Candidatus Aenigmarchaeota archaeon]